MPEYIAQQLLLGDGNYLTMPASAGSSGQVLSFDGSGGLTPATAAVQDSGTGRVDISQINDTAGLRIIGFDDQNDHELDFYIDSGGYANIDADQGFRYKQGGTNVSYISADGGNGLRMYDNIPLTFGATGATRFGFERNSVSGNLLLGYNEMNTTLWAVTPTGQLGIGTDAPATLLTLEESVSTSTPMLTIHANTSTTEAGGAIDFANSSQASAIGARIASHRLGAGAYSDLRFSVLPSGGSLTEAMRIDSTGFVGIGTTTPATILDMEVDNSGTAAPSTANAIQLANTNATAGNMSALVLSQISGGVGGAAVAGVHTDRTGGTRTSDLALYYYDQSVSSSPIEGMRISSEGQLLVGSTSLGTSSKMEVRGTTTGGNDAVVRIVNETATLGHDVLRLMMPNAASGALNFSNDSGQFWRWFLGSSGEMRFDSNDGTSKFYMSETGRARLSDDLMVGKNAAAETQLHVYQDDGLTDSGPGVLIEQDGTGDSSLTWRLTGTKEYTAGIDNSDSDKWKLTESGNEIIVTDGDDLEFGNDSTTGDYIFNHQGPVWALSYQNANTEYGRLELDAGSGQFGIKIDSSVQAHLRLSNFYSGSTIANGIDILGASTTNAPEITAYGTDANIDLVLGSKGSGNIFLDPKSGNGVGVGVISPDHMLEIGDGFRTVPVSSPSGTAEDGRIYMDSDDSRLKVYANGADRPVNTMTPVIVRPQQLIADSTSGFGITTRNQHVLAAFDDSTDEIGYYTGILPDDYQGDGLTVEINWIAATATSGDVRWLGSFERLANGGIDLDSDSFAADNAGTSTARAISGIIRTTTISFTDGADMDSIAAGDTFRFRVTRDASNAGDTMTGDAQIVSVLIKGTNDA